MSRLEKDLKRVLKKYPEPWSDDTEIALYNELDDLHIEFCWGRQDFEDMALDELLSNKVSKVETLFITKGPFRDAVALRITKVKK